MQVASSPDGRRLVIHAGSRSRGSIADVDTSPARRAVTVPRGAAFVGGAVVAVVLAVLVVAAAGPVRWAAPIHLGIYGGRGTFPSLPPQVQPTLPTPTASPCAGSSCPTPDPKALHLPGWLALVAAIALLVLALRLRRRRFLAAEDEPDDADDDADDKAGASPPPEVSGGT